MIVAISLTEAEQEYLLRRRPEYTAHDLSIAGKIRRAQADAWTDELLATPDVTPCGRCDIPRNVHDVQDHDWQWFRKRDLPG